MKAYRVALSFLLLGLTILFPACDTKTGANGHLIIVDLLTGEETDTGYTLPVMATTQNDPQNAVTFSVSGGGSLTNVSALSATYVAPSTASTPFTATVTATDKTDPTKSASAQITVNPLPAITTTTLSNATQGNSYTATINLTGGTSAFTWGATGLPAGLILGSSTTNSVTITGTPTTQGSSTIQITATDKIGAKATAQLPLTVNANTANCPNNGNFTGNFSYSEHAWVTNAGSSAFYGAVGTVSPDGQGNITGRGDSNGPSGPDKFTVSGTYCLKSNNLGLMESRYTTSGGQTFDRTLSFSLNSSRNSGNFIFYDNSFTLPQGVGEMHKLTTSLSLSAITGNYSAGAIGVNSMQLRGGFIASFTANGTNAWTGELDLNNAGTAMNSTFSSSNVNVDSTGRATFTLNVGAYNYNYAGYGSPSHFVFVQIDPITSSNYISVGEAALQQGLAGNNTDLNGTALLELQGVGSNGPRVDVGYVNANNGSLSYNIDSNHGGTIGNSIGTALYSVAPNERVTLSGGGGTNPPLFYLYKPNQGYALQMDGAVSYGRVRAVSAIVLNSGDYFGGDCEPPSSVIDWKIFSDNVTVGPTGGTITGMVNDWNMTAGPQVGSVSGSFPPSSTGRLTVTNNGTTTDYIYPFSSTGFAKMPLNTNAPVLSRGVQ